MHALLQPATLGSLTLRNRIVMAPMTRNRALPGDVPGALAALYYGARASAGLIVTEGTQPSKHGKGYCRTPGIHTPAQIEGWQQVTRAVHAAGGCIVLQLMQPPAACTARVTCCQPSICAGVWMPRGAASCCS
jgi:N-ethylmaleimide reductase